MMVLATKGKLVIECGSCEKRHEILPEDIFLSPNISSKKIFGIKDYYESRFEIHCNCGKEHQIKHIVFYCSKANCCLSFTLLKEGLIISDFKYSKKRCSFFKKTIRFFVLPLVKFSINKHNKLNYL